LKFAGTVHFGNIIMQLSYRLDLYLVNLYLGAAAAGTYYIGVRIAEQVWLASQPVATVLLPEFAANHKQKSVESKLSAELMVRFALYASAVIGAVLCLVVRPVVGILFGDAYRSASELVFWLLPGVLIFNASRIAAVAMTARGEPELNLRVNAFVLATNLVANVLLIPRLQMFGAALAASTAYTLGTLFALMLLARQSGIGLAELVTPTASDLALLRGLMRRARARRP
jgi:O-antigen/teichoic acid export membrane protein